MRGAEVRLSDPAASPGGHDDGLRRLLAWTFVALVLSVLAAAAFAALAIRIFDTP